MLCVKFELIPIKIRFFMNFQSCSKIGSKSLCYSTGQEYIIYRESIQRPYRSLLHERVFAQSHIPHTPVYLQYHVIKHVATFAGPLASKNFVISSNTRKELERRLER